MRFDKSFFEKHQSTLLKLARSKWTRWFLGLHRTPKEIADVVNDIQKITPNSIHSSKLFLEDGRLVRRWQAVCYSHPRFAEALTYNLHPFVNFYSRDKRTLIWRLSPVGALLLLVTPFIPKLGFLGFIGTTTDFSAGSGDGIVYYTGAANNLWATFRDATTGAGSSTVTTDGNDGSQAGSPNIFTDGNTRYAGSRAFFPFDTSALTSGAVVSSASLFLCSDAYASRNTYANNAVEVTESTVTSDTALATSDFNNWNDTKWATGIMHDSLAASGNFNEFVLNSTGYGAINKTGYSKYCVRYAYDVDNSAPGLGAGRRIVASFRFSEYSGTSSDPYLRVVYTNATIVTPSALALTSSLLASTLRVDKRFSVSALALTSAILSSAISIRQTFFASALPIIATLYSPSLLFDNRFVVAALSLAATLSAPVVSGGTLVAVSALAITTALLSPTLIFGWTVFPDTLTISAVLQLIASRWNPRTKPTSTWTERTPPTTNWNS